ncbi:MAG: hypothetical protein HYX54_04230 [Chloroflexi bacterium]|nr:hypothetical protein [Chloroflexota bacterium]
MAAVVVTPTAYQDLGRIISSHSLPADSRHRVIASLRVLARFPRLGGALEGRWAGFRFLLGPWRWMLLVYVFDEAADRVAVVTIQDARSARSATTSR